LRHIASLPHINPDAIAFETFAGWYTGGGFNVAPWLELLDLAKLLGLLDDSERRKRQATLPSHLPQVFPSPRTRVEPPALPAAVDILFTFPLANRRSLVVLREDAVYVREVVEKLGLVSTTPDDVWTSLFASAKKKPDLPVKASEKPRQRKPGTGKSMDVDQATFVECMESIVEAALNGRKRPLKGKAKTSKSVKETLENFFQSFDLEQIDRVSLNQLMGGLSLLCDGKKSSKLAFGFGLFDNSSPAATKAKKKKSDMPSLSGEELFLFLRSFLIVTFSCCRQSMDLTAEAVGRYISDTAHMVAEDVMRYQWQSCKQDRVNFDEFGEWYNEGGFETAPWLELLDLKKWVLVDDLDSIQQHRASAMPQRSPRTGGLSDFDCPPAPPDDAMDPSFFADDDHPIMPMDSIDEMDLMLLQQPSQDKENDRLLRTNKTFNTLLASPKSPKRPQPQAPPPRPPPQPQSSLKFHLVTNDKHSGYMLSVSPRRVSHLRHILIDSGLCQVDAEDAAREIMRKASPPKDSKMNGDSNNNRLTMDKDAFDSAIRSILTLTQGKGTLNPTTQRVLFDLLSSVFHAFERTQPGNPNAREIACGLTILCRGKKSDKLEFAFEMLDETGSGQMTRHQVGRYLSSFLSALLSVATASCLESDGIGEDSLTLMNGDRCDRSMLGPAVDAGSEWATNQAFQSRFKTKGPNDALTFDDFADWYTTEGFSSIPWLELLDLRKWVLTSS
jgi:Ca2+-binding EF-hand superfamily protein